MSVLYSVYGLCFCFLVWHFKGSGGFSPGQHVLTFQRDDPRLGVNNIKNRFCKKLFHVGVMNGAGFSFVFEISKRCSDLVTHALLMFPLDAC